MTSGSTKVELVSVKGVVGNHIHKLDDVFLWLTMEELCLLNAINSKELVNLHLRSLTLNYPWSFVISL